MARNGRKIPWYSMTALFLAFGATIFANRKTQLFLFLDVVGGRNLGRCVENPKTGRLRTGWIVQDGRCRHIRNDGTAFFLNVVDVNTNKFVANAGDDTDIELQFTNPVRYFFSTPIADVCVLVRSIRLSSFLLTSPPLSLSHFSFSVSAFSHTHRPGGRKHPTEAAFRPAKGFVYRRGER